MSQYTLSGSKTLIIPAGTLVYTTTFGHHRGFCLIGLPPDDHTFMPNSDSQLRLDIYLDNIQPYKETKLLALVSKKCSDK